MNRSSLFTTQDYAGTLDAVTDDDGEFGPFLDAAIRAAGISQREAAQRAGVAEGTVRAYIKGYIKRAGTRIPVVPTTATVVKLAAAIGFELDRALRLAGLEMPDSYTPRPASAGQAMSTALLLDALKERMDELEAAARGAYRRLPPHSLTDAQIRARGRMIVRLNVIADEARDGGDATAAQALSDLAAALNAQLEAAMAEEISEAQSRSHQANDK